MRNPALGLMVLLVLGCGDGLPSDPKESFRLDITDQLDSALGRDKGLVQQFEIDEITKQPNNVTDPMAGSFGAKVFNTNVTYDFQSDRKVCLSGELTGTASWSMEHGMWFVKTTTLEVSNAYPSSGQETIPESDRQWIRALKGRTLTVDGPTPGRIAAEHWEKEARGY